MLKKVKQKILLQLLENILKTLKLELLKLVLQLTSIKYLIRTEIQFVIIQINLLKILKNLNVMQLKLELMFKRIQWNIFKLNINLISSFLTTLIVNMLIVIIRNFMMKMNLLLIIILKFILSMLNFEKLLDRLIVVELMEF